VDGISVWSVVLAESPVPRQHFFQFFGVIAPGFIGCANPWQAFFRFLNHGLHRPHGFQKTRSRDLSIPAALESYQLLTISFVTVEALASGEASVSAVFAAWA
jgi:hypothetical protein